MDQIRLDFGNLITPHVDGGLDPAALAGPLAERFRGVHAGVVTRHERGELGFLDLPHSIDSVAQVMELADRVAQSFDDVVVLGIGGSGLGAIALKEALLGPGWNTVSDDGRDHRPRLHIVDNPDPCTFRTLFRQLEASRTIFNVVSKSGATAETMSQYLVARAWMDAAVGQEKARRHFLFTTDPGDGVLRQIGEAEGVPMLSIPRNVGGRFSVFSPVGLFPAAVCGVALDELLSGAAAMEQRCRTDHLSLNPAGILATVLHHADTSAGRPIHVLMPYADRLRPVALWFQQLWAESLGKALLLTGEERPTGPTPLASVGATDQHSLLQLFMEGPRDKVVVFIDVDDPGMDVEIPHRHPEIPALAYLGGHTMGNLLRTERAATAEALRRQSRPNATLHLPRIGAAEVGQLLMLFQIATVYAGAMYGVEPLDQPGVELSKRLTYGLMGREGVEVPDIPEPDPRWVL